jgi:hypothetical protein
VRGRFPKLSDRRAFFHLKFDQQIAKVINPRFRIGGISVVAEYSVTMHGVQFGVREQIVSPVERHVVFRPSKYAVTCRAVLFCPI